MNPAMIQIISAREFEVLKLIAQGHKNRDVALRLEITERTVRFHVENILEKLGVKNRTEAACVALKQGWVVDDEI